MRPIVPFLLYFFIYSFLGWVIETLYATFKNKKFTKRRGTFTEYFLPLYGGCAVMIVFIFKVIENHILAALLSGITVTFFEYLTGWVLDQKLHMKLWDYSTSKWHIGSYVCLPFTIIWCFLAYFLSVFIHPHIKFFVMRSSTLMQLFALTLCILVYGLDLLTTGREPGGSKI